MDIRFWVFDQTVIGNFNCGNSSILIPLSWLVGPLVDWSVGWLVSWLIGQLVGWSVGRLVSWFVDQLVGRSVGWLVNWLVGQLVG
jgi:hypothetical protein